MSRPSPVPTPPQRRPNVLVYLVDTLRADHLGCYGYDRPTSPRLDAFARDAILFTNPSADSSWPPPTVASLFTAPAPPPPGVPGQTRCLSSRIALQPGALISAGTPAGVGPIKAGDKLEGHVDGVGDLVVTYRG